MSEYTHWLSKLTTKEGEKLAWTSVHDQAWDKLTKLVENVKLLAHPQDEGEFLVQCDASNYAIGAVLFQKQYNKKLNTNEWKIIEFYSKQLDLSHRPYYPAIKECIALAYSLNH